MKGQQAAVAFSQFKMSDLNNSNIHFIKAMILSGENKFMHVFSILAVCSKP